MKTEFFHITFKYKSKVKSGQGQTKAGDDHCLSDSELGFANSLSHWCIGCICLITPSTLLSTGTDGRGKVKTGCSESKLVFPKGVKCDCQMH